MIKYFREADEENQKIDMDVQVGPDKEIEVEVDPEEAVPGTPVDEVKKNPDALIVAVKGEEGCCEEAYVDAADVEHYAMLNNKSMMESLNDIIAANEAEGVEASNLCVVISEGMEGYVEGLESYGVHCIRFMTEADAIEMDVQIGPNDEEIHVEEDPQEANPVDAVKRDYNNVTIVAKDDKFFMDVEDVQKCAELNCESVIETLNKLIDLNEGSGMEASNIILIDNSKKTELIDSLCEAGVVVLEMTNLEELYKECEKAENFLRNNGEDMSKTQGPKAGVFALEILDIVDICVAAGASFSGILYATFRNKKRFITTLVIQLMTILAEWGIRFGEEKLVDKYARECIAKFNSIIAKVDDEKEKERLIAQRDKLEQLRQETIKHAKK